ncbi:hypothetical protein [Nocardia nova]
MCNNPFDLIARLHAALHGLLYAPVGILPPSYGDAIIVLPWGA